MSTRVQRSEYQNLIPIQTFRSFSFPIKGSKLDNSIFCICEGKEDACIEPAVRLWKTPDNRTIKLCTDCEREIKLK